MARELFWLRGAASYAGNVAYVNAHHYQIGTLAVGQTLTRTRFRFWLGHTATDSLHGVGMMVAVGIIVGPSTWTAADVPDPFLDPIDDWLWWEAGTFQPELGATTAGSVREHDVYPGNTLERDVKAQRAADPAVGSSVWIATGTQVDNPDLTVHYMSYGYSLGVLAAP